jgi:hypothetical protein
MDGFAARLFCEYSASADLVNAAAELIIRRHGDAVLCYALKLQWADDMKIDIDNLTEAELIDLNNRIVQRLR